MRIYDTYEHETETRVTPSGITKTTEKTFRVRSADGKRVPDRVVTYYEKDGVSARVVDFCSCQMSYGRQNAQMTGYHKDGAFTRIRTFKDVSNAHAKAVEFVLANA